MSDMFDSFDDSDLLEDDSAKPVATEDIFKSDDSDLLGDDSDLLEGDSAKPVATEDIFKSDDSDLLDEPVSTLNVFAGFDDSDLLDESPTDSLFGGQDDSDLLDEVPAKPALLLAKEEFLELATRKAGDITEEEISGQYGKDEINAIFQTLLTNPRYFISLKTFYETACSFENKILDRIISTTAPREVLPNPVGKLSEKDAANLFIDGENHVSNLVEAFRRKLQASILMGKDYTAEEFLNSSVSELKLELPCHILRDIFNSPRDVATVKNMLETLKKEHFYATMSAAENKSYSQDSLISLMKTTFNEYKETFDICDKLREFMSGMIDAFNDSSIDRATFTNKTDSMIGDSGLKLDDTDKVYKFTYPSSYSTLNDTYTCGSCLKTHTMKVPFLAAVYLDSDSTILPGLNVCPDCGCINFAADETYRSLISIKNDEKELSEFFHSRIRKASSNFIKYITPDQSGVDQTLTAKPVQEEDDAVSEDDIWNAVERYKAKVRRHITYKEDSKVNHAEANLGKFMSRYFDQDSSIRNKAIATIIHHLSDRNGFAYGKYLRYSNYVAYESVIDSEDLLNHVGDCSDVVFQRRMQHLYGVLGIPYTDDYVFDKLDINVLMDAYDDYKNEFEYFKKMREHYIRDIERNISDLANLEVIQISISEDDYLDFMCCEDVRNLIYKWADRMVIYSSAENFMNLRLATKSKFVKFIDGAFFAEDFVSNAQSFFPIFNLSKDTRPAVSLYPCADLNSVFTEVLDLKGVYAKDRFDFFIRLNQFIKILKESDSVKYDKIIKRVVSGRLLPEFFRNNALLMNLEKLESTYGKSGKALYYLRGQFSEEEIKSTVKPYHVIAYSKYMSKRREGESLESYIDRITDKDYNPRYDELYKLDLDDELLDTIRRSYVGLDALAITAYSVYSFQRIKEHNVYFAGKLLFDTLLKYHTENDIFRLLDYSSETVNGLIDTFIEEDLFPDNFDEYKNVMRFSALLYSDPIVSVEMSGTYSQRKAALYNVAAFTGDVTNNQMVNDFVDQIDQSFLRAKVEDNADIYVQQAEYVKPSVQKELFDFLNIQG